MKSHYKTFDRAIANKSLFDLLLKQAAKTLLIYPQTKTSDPRDDCNDKQTRQHKTEGTLGLHNDKSH